jgi:hypothetical protein
MGKPCPSVKFCTDASTGPVKTAILHTTGLQYCNIVYCACIPPGDSTWKPIERPIQLIQAGLYPATFKAPVSATTLDAYTEFSHFTHRAKVNAEEFCDTKTRMTNNEFKDDVPVRIPSMYVVSITKV